MSVEWSTELTSELVEAYRELRESHLSMLCVLDDTLQRNLELREELKTRDITQMPIQPFKEDSFDGNFFTEGEKLDKFGDELEKETESLRKQLPTLMLKQAELEAENRELKENLEISKKSVDYLKADRDALKLELESLKKAKQIMSREFEVNQTKLESQREENLKQISSLNEDLDQLRKSYQKEIEKTMNLSKQLEATYKLLEDEKLKQQETEKNEHDSLTLVEQRQGLVLPPQDPGRDSLPVEPITIRGSFNQSADKDNLLDDIVIVEDRPASDTAAFNTLGRQSFDKKTRNNFDSNQKRHLEETLAECRSRLEAEQRSGGIMARKIKDLVATIDDLKRIMRLQNIEQNSHFDSKLSVSGKKTKEMSSVNRGNNQILMELEIENNLTERKPDKTYSER